MPIEVEFFGIPRQRAGVERTSAEAVRLGDVLVDLEQRFPGLAESCLRNGQLQKGVVVNLRGERFVSDPDTELNDGDAILILSADAGG